MSDELTGKIIPIQLPDTVKDPPPVRFVARNTHRKSGGMTVIELRKITDGEPSVRLGILFLEPEDVSDFLMMVNNHGT